MDIQIASGGNNLLDPTTSLQTTFESIQEDQLLDYNVGQSHPLMYSTMPTQLLHPTTNNHDRHTPSPPYEDLQGRSPEDGDQGDLSPGQKQSGRPLSTSKRAEQNRRAQRAFRERRDAHMKQLETRAALLEEALEQANEANRRWEETRALVDQLRHENAMLRAALDKVQTLTGAAISTMAPPLEQATLNDSVAPVRTHPSLQDIINDDPAQQKKRKRAREEFQAADVYPRKRRENSTGIEDDS